MNGNVLLVECVEECKETTDFMHRSRCVGYIKGISDAHSTFATWGRMEPKFCVPTSVTKGQLRKFVVKLRRSIEKPCYNSYPPATLSSSKQATNLIRYSDFRSKALL